MIYHSNSNFFMDWEPAESYGMDVDEEGPEDVPMYMTQQPFSSADCDVCMAPSTVQDVHMASPILTFKPTTTISEIAFFLPPLELKTKPIVFPPFDIHAVSRQPLDPCGGFLDNSPFIYVPAVATYQAKFPTMASANTQCDTYTSAIHNLDHFPSKSVYRPVTPSPSNSRTTFGDVSPIFVPANPIDILEEDGQIADSRAATLSPLIENTSFAGWSNRMTGPGDIAPNFNYIPCPDSIDEQVVTPSAPYFGVTKTNTPEWIDERDVTPSASLLVVAESNTPEWIDEQDVTPSTPHETNTPEWIDEQDVMPSTPHLETNTPEWIDEQDVTPSTPHETNTPEWIDEQDVMPSTPHLETNTPEWIDEQDVTPSTPHETNTPEWIDEQDVTPSTPHLETNTPEWIDEQDVTPTTPHSFVAESNTPEWTVDEDVTPLFQYPILEAANPFHWPEMPFLQEYVDLGVDLIGLWSPSFDSLDFDKDDFVFRAFGGSSLGDLDWILEGFRATSVVDACIESKNALNSFEALSRLVPLHNSSPVSPYDWAVSEAGPDLISFDSAQNLCHDIRSGSFELPSFNSGDVVQTESNGFFQTSTPAAYNKSAYEVSPDVQSRFPFDPSVIFSKVAYTVERNAPRSTKRDASTQTEEFPGATYSLRPQRRYSPYVRYSPYRKLSRDFLFGSAGLESAQSTITSCTSCGLPSPVDNVSLDCSIQASIISEVSEMELDARPTVRVNSKEPEEEDDQEKEMTFPGAYPIEQVVYALDKSAKLRTRHLVKVAPKNHFKSEVPPCPTVHPSAQHGFKELLFRIFAYIFDW